MTAKTVGLTIDLNQLAAVAHVAIWRSFQLVSFSMHSADTLIAAVTEGKANSELPGLKEASIQLKPHPSADDELRSLHERWVLTNGLRDAIEAVNMFLEEVRVVCATWRLTGKGAIPAQEYLSIEAFRPRFNEYGLPPKLKHLNDEFALWPDASAYSDVISINDARNCLVHRSGQVSSNDMKKSPEGLVVSWRRIGLRAGVGNDERILMTGSMFEAGETITARIEARWKLFRSGERIAFSPQEFAEICLTLRTFVSNSVRAVEHYGRNLTLRVDSGGDTSV